MKKALFISILLLSISVVSHAWRDGYYQFKLIDVDTNNQTTGEFKTQKNQFGIDNSTYEDGFINVLFTVHPTHISFTLNNNTNSRMKIIWDEAVYSDFDNSSGAVFHSGTKYIKKDETQVSTTIMKGSKIEDIIAPKSLSVWSKKRWVHYPILRWGKRMNNGTMGNTISVQLPLEIDGKIIDYIFTFECLWHQVKVKTRGSGNLLYFREVKQ